MGRIYTATLRLLPAEPIDLFEIVAPATTPVAIHEIGFSRAASDSYPNEVGDFFEKMLLILFKSGQTTTGSGGEAATITPLLFGDAASGATVTGDNHNLAQLGTIVTHYVWHWNVRHIFRMIWAPAARPVLIPSRRATFELVTTPRYQMKFNGYILFEELI